MPEGTRGFLQAYFVSTPAGSTVDAARLLSVNEGTPQRDPVPPGADASRAGGALQLPSVVRYNVDKAGHHVYCVSCV